MHFFDTPLVEAHALSGADANYTSKNLLEVEIVSIQVSSDKDYGLISPGTTKVKILVINTKSIITINTSPTAGGTGYAVGDILTLTEGTKGTVEVTAVTGGVVDTVTLRSGGFNYTTGTGKSTTGGTGTGCTIEIIHVANFVERTALLIDVKNPNETHIRTISDFDGRYIRCDVTKGNASAGTLAIHLLGKIK